MAKVIITMTDTKGTVTNQTAGQQALLQLTYNWLQDPDAAVIHIEKQEKD